MTGLHDVAEHLSARAKELEGDSADAFGRSAFNRYYYATFLTVRELIGLLDPSWESQSHASIPDLLEGAFLKLLKREAKKQAKLGLITKGRESSIITKASSATTAIAGLLRSAYSVRIASDYEPQEKVVFSNSGFSIVSHTDSEARNWKSRVEKEKGVLIGISKELGFVS